MADRGRLFYDSNGKLRQVDPAASISGEPSESDLEPVEFEEASITGQSFVKLSLSSNITGISAATYTNPYDTVDVDNLNEVNASIQFVPAKTAYYMIIARARIDPGADGDQCQILVENTSTSTGTELETSDAGGSSSITVMGLAVLELTAGDPYEVLCRDVNNSFDIVATTTTGATIYKLPVHPP